MRAIHPSTYAYAFAITALSTLGLGEVQLQQFGAPNDVLIRIAEQPGGETAQQEAVNKVRGALGNEVEYRRVEVVGPRVSGELLSYGVIGLGLAIMCILIYLCLCSSGGGAFIYFQF